MRARPRFVVTTAVLYVVSTFAAAILFAGAIGRADTLIPESPSVKVTFCHFRIEFETTSDWSVLEPSNPDRILTVKTIEVSGSPNRLEVQTNRVSLGQPVTAAQGGNRVGVVFDYYVEASDWPSGGLSFSVQKGSLNETTVRLYEVSGTNTHLIQEATVTGQHDASTGAYWFTPSAWDLRSVRPNDGEIKIAPKKLVWAFYYPWYSMKDWSSDRLKDHPLTKYSSGNREAIARHIDSAKVLGIDGFICSWWGPEQSDQVLKTILDVAKEKNFLITIHLEILTKGKPRPVDTISKWLAFAIKNYAGYPAFMKVAGKPLIVVWATEKLPREQWQAMFADLRGQGLDAFYMAQGYDLQDLEVFDGLYQYANWMPGPSKVEYLKAAARGTRYYPLTDMQPGETPGPKICAASVCPGYDDTLVPGRKGLVIDRKGGDFYRSAFETAIRMDPDWIFVSTWNEWWENTYIEPSELYDGKYTDMTREYTQKWKDK
jgi:hypothetical protein